MNGDRYSENYLAAQPLNDSVAQEEKGHLTVGQVENFRSHRLWLVYTPEQM